jgi:hypothetical protein
MSNGQQYIQWLTDEKFGVVEAAEQLFDGTKDVVIPQNGVPIPMHAVGKKFIMLPGREFALDTATLRQMHPTGGVKQKRREPAKSDDDPSLKASRAQAIQGLAEASIFPPQTDIPSNTPVQEKKSSSSNSFVQELLQKAKTKKTKITIELEMELPNPTFYSMMSESFSEDVVDSMIDELVSQTNPEDIRRVISESVKSLLSGVK